ncbi:MAG TPA: hypothetical protein VMI75_05280 [Polyangiaceae bacterium]|nr:hypothetical protein [Polyangiaceae bacterium]
MVRTLKAATLASLCVVLFGCPSLLKKQGDDAGGTDSGPAATASTPEAAAPTAASNDGDITHYPDQNPGNNETLNVRTMVAARTEASTTGGKLVTELKPGMQATKLADHEGFDLVTFTDPSNPSNKLEGWVHATAFGAIPTPVHVDGGVVPTVTDGGAPPACKPQPLDLKKNANGSCNAGYAACGAMCRMTCKADADCCLATAHCTGGYCLGPGAAPCGH